MPVKFKRIAKIIKLSIKKKIQTLLVSILKKIAVTYNKMEIRINKYKYRFMQMIMFLIVTGIPSDGSSNNLMTLVALILDSHNKIVLQIIITNQTISFFMILAIIKNPSLST